ncbi:Ribonuclease P protein subunit RPR2 [Candida viswanathii]|uniref:Ribonuclease P protein subunit RPR2 n=1 Tax=Candida viswanathii TaxID=5486 RepID=A0A367YAG2_9ASCO|nr:Ribonuclease P protein subunit RPR2 [Candida viswanathii]
MAKKKEKGNGKSVANIDNYARLSHLYQISNQLTTSHPGLGVLARGYNRNLDLIAKKTVTKVSPHLKRSICKKCNTLLIPGLTVTIYIENLSREKLQHCDVLVNKCSNCGECKRFPVGKNRDYQLFVDRTITK